METFHTVDPHSAADKNNKSVTDDNHTNISIVYIGKKAASLSLAIIILTYTHGLQWIKQQVCQ